MDKVIRLIDRINEGIGTFVSWLTTVLVLLICFDVFCRYFLSSTATWIIELEWHLFGLIFLLGAAYTWKHDDHVRVDVFYQHFGEKTKAWINLLGSILFVIPWCYVVIKTATHYGMNSLYIHEGSPNPNGLPARYIIKFSIVFGFVLILLQALAEIMKSIQVVSKSKMN